MEGKREHLGRQIAREGGKPLSDALVETDRAIDGVRNAAEELRIRAGREIPMGLTPASDRPAGLHDPRADRRGRRDLRLQPPAQPDRPSGRAGDRHGLPGDRQARSTTPLSCLEFVGLLHEAGLPPDWCQTFLPETNELAEALATDPRVAFLSFIGSARVGWYLRSKLPPGTRCALEHGGAAPVIIDRQRRPRPADRADGEGRLLPCRPGLRVGAAHLRPCGSHERASSSASPHGWQRFGSAIRALRETEVGPLILPREADRVAAWIEEAVAGGARLIGGGRLSEHDAQAGGPGQPAARRQGLDARSVRADDLRLSVHAARRRDRGGELAAASPSRRASSPRICRTAFDAAERLRRLGRHGQRPYRLPHRLDAVRRPPPVRLRHRRHPLDDATR